MLKARLSRKSKLTEAELNKAFVLAAKTVVKAEDALRSLDREMLLLGSGDRKSPEPDMPHTSLIAPIVTAGMRGAKKMAFEKHKSMQPNPSRPLPLSARLAAAAPDDWALWKEINSALVQPNETIAANARIILLAQRLNRPDLLIAVALSWVPEGTPMSVIRHENGRSYAECGDEPWQYDGLSPANALGSAALKAREAPDMPS